MARIAMTAAAARAMTVRTSWGVVADVAGDPRGAGCRLGKVTRTLVTVVLPEPLGPRKPKNSP
jgi:hypothetical protein